VTKPILTQNPQPSAKPPNLRISTFQQWAFTKFAQLNQSPKICAIDFLSKQFSDRFDRVTFVETYCWNMDMCKSELP